MIIACIIMKNEAHVIRRCLESLSEYVDGVLMMDTGSHPEQLAYCLDVANSLKDVHSKAFLIESMEWDGFARSRNQCLRTAEELFMLSDTDYLFMIDADDYVTRWIPHTLDKAGYKVEMQGQGISYSRVNLFRARSGWQYRGVVHEAPYAKPELAFDVGEADISVMSTREGARSQNPKKYYEDAVAIEKALHKEELSPDEIARYRFYLAQSWRDAGHLDLASDNYERRIELGGWGQEVYVAYVELAKISYHAHYKGKPEGISALVVKAQKACPDRREAVCLMMEAHRDAKEWEAVIKLYNDYPSLPEVPKGLFIDQASHTFKQHEEAAIAYYYLGDFVRSAKASALALRRHPQCTGDIERLIINLTWATRSLDTLPA